ncbi:MAG: exosortase-associated EpsI family protein [Phycisphaerales bacterium]
MRIIIHHLRQLAPLLSLALLVLITIVHYRAASPTAAGDAYRATVRAEVERLPYRVGEWVGKDSEPTAAAVDLLKPNVIVQRTFFHPETMETVSLLFVHCSDIRDMAGHYPPICYPSHGWIKTNAEVFDLPVGSHTRQASLYEFRWPVTSVRPAMQVVNLFVAPDDTPVIARDLDALRSAAAPGVLSTLGVGQFQLVLPATLGRTERVEIASEFMAAIQPLIAAVGTRPDESASSLREGNQ